MRGVRQAILDGTFARLKEDIGGLMQRGQKSEQKETEIKKSKTEKSRNAQYESHKNSSNRKRRRAAI